VAFVLFLILYPEQTNLFFRKTDSDVAEVMRMVAKGLKNEASDTLVRKLYGHSLLITRETVNEINTNLQQNISGASQLVGLGITTSITGKHADVVSTDDIVNIKDRISKAEREATKRQYMELQNVKNRGGRIINTGTPWHPDDAFKLMPNPVTVDIYHAQAMLSQTEIEHLRQSMTPSLFAANYELKHIANEDALFGNPIYAQKTRKDEQLFHRLFGGIGHIDAAYGGADGTAFSAIKKNTATGKITAFGARWNKHVDDCLDEILEISTELKLGTIHCEENADKGYLKKELRKHWPSIHGYHESMNKYIKIASYLRKFWSDIEFLPETDPDFMNEILDYTEHAEHDDSPDSLASLIREIEGKSGWLY
jgi:hypothetical protein